MTWVHAQESAGRGQCLMDTQGTWASAEAGEASPFLLPWAERVAGPPAGASDRQGSLVRVLGEVRAAPAASFGPSGDDRAPATSQRVDEGCFHGLGQLWGDTVRSWRSPCPLCPGHRSHLELYCKSHVRNTPPETRSTPATRSVLRL